TRRIGLRLPRLVVDLCLVAAKVIRRLRRLAQIWKREIEFLTADYTDGAITPSEFDWPPKKGGSSSPLSASRTDSSCAELAKNKRPSGAYLTLRGGARDPLSSSNVTLFHARPM